MLRAACCSVKDTVRCGDQRIAIMWRFVIGLIFFPRANNGARVKKKFLAKRFAHVVSVLCRDLEHAYVY